MSYPPPTQACSFQSTDTMDGSSHLGPHFEENFRLITSTKARGQIAKSNMDVDCTRN